MHAAALRRQNPPSARQTARSAARVGLSLLVATALSIWPTPAATSPKNREARQGEALGKLNPAKRFVYRAEGKRLAEVLQDFAASQGLPGVVADGVEGVVNADFDERADAFLDVMVKAYGIVWYSDGMALYFYPARALQSRLFRMKGFDSRQIKGLLATLNVNDTRYPIRFDPGSNTLSVAGPPRHVDLVTAAVEALDANAAEQVGPSWRAIPLKYASAADRPMGETLVKGVASVLQTLFGSGEGPATDPSQNVALDIMRERASKRPQLPKVAANQFAPGSKQLSPEPAESKPVQFQAGAAPAAKPDSRPRFEADEGTNSVLVMAPAERMADIEALIQTMDQRPVQVELEASIIEVNAENVQSLGVNWSMTGSLVQASVVNPGIALNPSYALSAVIANGGASLLAKVQALQGEGKARILSKPIVLGVVNRAAVMREKRIATVRVAGNLEANLFQVEAGTQLQMTPQVFSSNGKNRIKLSLYIEDGSFETNLVDQVPVLKKTEIHTEAYVNEGDSLLIAGITVESEVKNGNGVPLLANLPVVGAAFRSSETRVVRHERLFLITPRLVDETPKLSRLDDASTAGGPAPRSLLGASSVALRMDLDVRATPSGPATALSRP